MVAKLAPPAPRKKSRSLLSSASRNSADDESAGIWKETDVSKRSGKCLILWSVLAVGGMVCTDLASVQLAASERRRGRVNYF